MPINDFDDVALLLLREALDLDTDAEREHLLAERCTDQPDLRDHVRALLLRTEAADPASISSQDDADPLLGKQLGPFRVVEAIGRGGMGRVYRGERESADFRQDVAIKLIRRGFDFDDIRARFLRERRILARLSHPNLARFIDGGVAPDGRPWFALEFVHGETITRWCDARRLDVRARVKLFLDVCAAVQYAHTQLVVHRDLKPGNVLVDQTGHVRLLDFGVAGLLAGGDADTARPSTIGAHPAMTPEYAAPEQFSGSGVSVGVDVYALGVILYELIAGVLPYQFDRSDPAAAERTVRETPPLSLLARDRDEAVGARRLAARSLSLRAYRTEVRGDLSRIVETALAKEPERRYPTVQALADDLARWLHGAPVRVSGDRIGYRVAKFVRRNRVVVALAALALVAAAAGVAGIALANVDARREAANAKHSAERARAEASVASGVSDFLGGVFGKAAPFNTGGKTLSLKEALEVARNEAMTAYKDQPEIRIPILLAVGNAYEKMYLKPEARATLADALAEADALKPPKPLLQAKAMSAFSELEVESDIDHSVSLAEGAVDLLHKAPDIDPRELISPLAKLAVALFHKSDFPRALDVTEERMAVFERTATTADDGYNEALSDKAMILAELHRYDEAIALHRRLVALRIAQAGHDDDLSVSYERSILARALHLAGRERESVEEMRRAIAVEKPIYGDNYRIAVLSGILAQALAGDGRYEEAEAEMTAALRIVEADAELKNRAVRMRASLAAIRSGAGHCTAARATLRALNADFPAASRVDEQAFVDAMSEKVDACIEAPPR
ncbi:MAG: serine/threonine-protein kinase [Dokdonella sp.]